jgi:hypothetical protein
MKVLDFVSDKTLMDNPDMNLFILDYDIDKNAQYHVDRHMKMLLEAMQLICTTFHLQGIKAPYACTHINHPCSIFTRSSKDNFQYVVDYVFALSKENIVRYDKVHASSLLLKWVANNRHLLSFPKVGMTEFALAMPDQYKTSDPVQSYRNYYNGDKRHIFKWTNREQPDWIVSIKH